MVALGKTPTNSAGFAVQLACRRTLRCLSRKSLSVVRQKASAVIKKPTEEGKFVP